MYATAISKMNRSIRTTKMSPLRTGVLLSSQVAVDNRKSSRWPAVKLAASRSPSAIGWASSLKVSIHTITGIKRDGVPCGTRCLSRLLKARKKPRIFTLIHMGMANL